MLVVYRFICDKLHCAWFKVWHVLYNVMPYINCTCAGTVDGSNNPVDEFTKYVEAVKEETLVAEYEVRNHT